MADDNQEQSETSLETTTGAGPTQDAAHTPDETGASDTDAQLDAILNGNFEGESLDAADGNPETRDEPADEFPDLKDEQSEEDGEDTDAEEDEEDAEPPAGQEESDQGTKNSGRFRFKNADDQAVAAIAKAKNISLVEAARLYAGDQPKPAEEADAGKEEATQGRTPKEIQAELDQARADKKKARVEMEWELENDLEDRVEALREELEAAKDSERQASQTAAQRAQAELNEAHEKSLAKAEGFYPSLTDEKSPLFKRVQELDAQAIRLGDPLANDPDKAMILAKQAAKELKIPMVDPKESKQGTTPAKKTNTRPAPLASGNARTSPAAQPVLEKEIDAIQTPGDYDRMLKDMGIGGSLLSS